MYRHDPGKGHWQVVKWVLQYLLKIVDVNLVFEQDDKCDQRTFRSPSKLEVHGAY